MRELTLPKGSEVRKRFITRGSPSQQAEPGGRRRYKPSGSNQPSAETGRNLPPITTGAIHSAIDAAFIAAKQPYDWRWPGEFNWPAGITREGKQLLFKQGGNVVDLVLVAHDDAWGHRHQHLRLLPARRTSESRAGLG